MDLWIAENGCGRGELRRLVRLAWEEGLYLRMAEAKVEGRRRRQTWQTEMLSQLNFQRLDGERINGSHSVS